MRSGMKFFVCMLATFLFTACSQEAEVAATRFSSELASVTAQPAKKTACVSFQGNGVYFSSHVGALIALLESNYEPVFATGGSSGAILASVSRALVENPSLAGRSGFNPQAAARVLSASAPIIESVLFLPRFTTPLMLLDSLDVFLTGSSLGVLRSDPTDGLVNAESIVGQASLVIDFYRSADFSAALQKNSITEREKAIALSWKNFANTIDVTPEQVADALLQSRESLQADGQTHLVSIQDRFFKLYRSKKDTFHTNYKTQQEAWNRLIGGNAKAFGLDSRERRQGLFKKLLERIKSLESLDALAATLSGQFMMADPERVYRAFEGFDSRTNRRIEIPSNTVIHSTARRAKKTDGEWKEARGIDNLHQVYFTNPAQSPMVADILTRPSNNPLQPQDRSVQPVIPSSRIVVTGQTLGPTLAATTGEPTAFLRFPLQLDVPARLRLGWTNVNEELFGYGGWLEKVSLGTGRQFETCDSRNVDVYFYTSDGDGVNRFAKMALLGLFLDEPMRGLLARQIGNPTDIKALLGGTSTHNGSTDDDIRTGFDAAVGAADSIFTDNRNARGRVGHIPVNFNYVNPSEVKGTLAEPANIAIRSNRRAMILAAYEFSRRVMIENKLARASLDLWNVSGDRISVLPRGNPDDILAAVNAAYPRLNY